MSQVTLVKSPDWASSKLETIIDRPLVIIDRQVTQLQSLVRDLQSRAHVVILDSERDGIEQITQALNQYQSISSLHLVAHGSSGCLYLGNSQLNLANINDYSQQLTSWAEFLTGKDILIYGCQVAKEQGQIFLEQLSRITGSNIAASSEVLGLTKSGSRYWQLEFQIGSLKTRDLIFSQSLRDSYLGAFIDFDEAVDGDLSNEPEDPSELTLEAGSNTISATTGAGDADQEFVTVTVPDGLQLDTVVLDAFSPAGDAAFVGVQEGDVFTEPLNESADTGSLLGFTLFGGGSGDIGSDILDNIGSGAGTIGFDGALPSGDYTFALQQLSEPSEYTLEFNVSEVAAEPETPETPTEEPETPMDELPVVSFEVVPANFSEESADNLVEWRWTVEGDFPEEGITVNLNTSGGDPDVPFDFTNQFAAEPEAEFIDAEIVGFDEETGELNILLTSPEASFQLFFINDIIEEGAQPFEFFLAEGEGYVVDPEQNGTLFTITDDNGGPGVGPTVGLSVSETDLAEGDPFTVTFDVEGEIPEAGVEVLVQSDVAGALGQFDLADLGNLELTGIDGLPSVGDGGGGSFFVTITEPTATISTSVFDDILAEEALEIPFTLANGELYEVDPEAGEVTINLADETTAAGPVVGISLDNTDVFEGDSVTLTFNVEGEIPEEGVTVLVNDLVSAGSEARSLTEFDVANIETTGIEGFPEPADGDSGFFVTITEPTATITLPVFDDGADEDEALESFTFEVIDGEAYDVAPDAGSVTLNITDVGDTPVDPTAPTEEPTETPTGELPEVSIAIEPDIISEEDTAPTGTVSLSVEGDIPEDGLSILVNGDLDILDQVDGTIDIGFDNAELGEFFDPETSNFEVVLSNNEASITLPILNDIIQEEDTEFGFTVLENDGSVASEYAVNPDASTDAVILVDDNGGPGVGPTVSLAASATELGEGEEFTVSFNVDGELPEEGLSVLVDSETFGVLGEFTLFDEAGTPLFETTGIEGVPIVGDTAASSFLVTLTEPEASITLSTFDDGADEGLEEFSFGIVDGEIYEVDPEAGEVAFSLDDGGTPPEEPTEPPTEPPAEDLTVLSFTASTDSLNEAEGTPLVLNFAVEGEFPEEGVIVRFDENFFDTEQIDFNIFELENLEFSDFEETSPGLFTIDYLLSAPEGSLTTAVFDDNIAEPEDIYAPGILEIPDANYVLDPDASGVEITVIDGVDGTGGPVVSIDAEPTELNEGDTITLTLTAEGEIPEEGIEINVDSETEAAVGDFITTDEAGIPLATITGFEGDLGPNADASGFIGTMVENTATITLDVFDDGPTEGTETFEFSILDGENYDISTDDSVSLTIDDGGEDAAFEVESGVTSVFLDLPLLEEAAGLTLVGTDSDAEPFSEDFQVGFAITEDTDFSFVPVPFTPLGGTIEHSGTITLGLGGAEATVGEFSIGFDESRVTDTASGFFVADTLEDPLGLEVLFDLGAPGTVSVSGETLEISDADLLLAPEVATALGLPDLAGADVGDALVDATVASTTPTEEPTETPSEPPSEETPVVSFSIEPDVVIEEDADASFTGTFVVDGEIPPAEFDADGNLVSGGLSVILDVKEVDVLGEQFDTFEEDGLTFGSFSDPEQPNLFEFVLLEETSTITINIFNDIIEEEPFEFNFELVDGEGIIESDYIVDPEVSVDSFTLEDGNGGPGVGPTVSLAISETELTEGDEFTVNFSVEGEIPEEGVTVLVGSETAAVLGEFALFDAEGTPLFETSGIEGVPEAGDGLGSSFFVTLTEPDASITLATFTEDEAEGLEEFSFSLVNGEIYEVDAEASEVAFSIDDGGTPPEEPTEPEPGDISFEPVFGSIDGDVIEVEGSGQLVFAGDLSDLVDASTGDGSNRIFAGSGDDTVILGASDRILAGEGDDAIFTTFGGDNTITGDAGADQFWIASAEIPDGTNVITDFTSGEDVIGIAGLGIGFADVSITAVEGDALIAAAGSELAILEGVAAESLTADDFAFG